MQKYTSANTSINKTKLPKVYSNTKFSGKVFDLGCGKYTVHIRRHLEKENSTLLPYDPFNQPANVNADSLNKVLNSIRKHEPVNVVCSNVLNVIDDDNEVQKICKRIEYIVRKTGGHGFLTVYEGDRSGIGRKTGADQYQRNEPIRNYLRFFRSAKVSKQMIVIE